MDQLSFRFTERALASLSQGSARARWISLALILALAATVSFLGCGGQPGAQSSESSAQQPVAHSVSLTWDPSTSAVIGYNVYRGTLSDGPYTKLNSLLLSVTMYTDNTVQPGHTYFYVTTAVDSNNVESVFSSEVSAAIPTP